VIFTLTRLAASSTACWGCDDACSKRRQSQICDRSYRHAQRLPGLSLPVQGTLKRDPMFGHLFVFRGRGGDLIKIIWHDGQGTACSQRRLSEDASSGRRKF
jgi:transposase